MTTEAKRETICETLAQRYGELGQQAGDRLREWLNDSASNSKSPVGTVTAGRRFDHAEMRSLFANSPISPAYEEFERRWQTAILADGIDRAPIRLMDIFDERPLLPFGPRRSLLPVMPGLFLGVGVFAALVGLIPSLAGEVQFWMLKSWWYLVV